MFSTVGAIIDGPRAKLLTDDVAGWSGLLRAEVLTYLREMKANAFFASRFFFVGT